MQILPAIDLKDRKVVRLYKGDFDTVHQVARDPVETARAFLRAGTRWVHMTWAYLGPSSVPPLSPIPNWYPTL